MIVFSFLVVKVRFSLSFRSLLSLLPSLTLMRPQIPFISLIYINRDREIIKGLPFTLYSSAVFMFGSLLGDGSVLLVDNRNQN